MWKCFSHIVYIHAWKLQKRFYILKVMKYLILCLTMLNYKSLRNSNQESYQKIFSNADLVISLPYSISLWPSSLNWLEEISLRKKIPSKIYLGMSESKALDCISFWEVSLYDVTSQKFYMQSISKLLNEEDILCIKKSVFRIANELEISLNIRVTLLLEQSNCSYNEVVCMTILLLSFCLDIYSEGTQNKNNYKRVYKIYERISESIFWSPIWLLLAKTVSSEWYDIRVKRWIKDDDKCIDSFKSIMWNTSCIDVFDYGLISFWFNDKISLFSDINNKFDDLWFLESLFKRNFYMGSWSNTKALIWYSNILKHFSQLNIYPVCEVRQKSLINTIGSAWFLLSSSDKIYELLIQLYNIFDTSKSWNDEKIWILPLNLTNWGWVFFFITLKHKSRDTFSFVKKMLTDSWYKNASLIYQSWIHGLTYEWFMVEQYISQWIFSEYISKTSVFIETEWEKRIGQHDVSIASSNEKVLLDWIYKKVFFKWKKSTYKDLRSQSSTVEILLYLIKNQERVVYNSELPPSSYSKNKNEMLWKIIYPLVTFMENNWLDIEIECEWNLYDFHLGIKKWTNHFALLTSIIK